MCFESVFVSEKERVVCIHVHMTAYKTKQKKTSTQRELILTISTVEQ